MRLLHERVREIRERKLMTQLELANATGMSEATINRLERGLQTPRISSVRKLAAALGVPADDIILWDEPTTEKEEAAE